MNQKLNEILTYDHMISHMKYRERLSFTPQPLQKHSIEPILRTRMVNWMVEVCSKFDFSSKIFFLSVKIMDKYLQHSQFSIGPNDIHLLGVTCMFIACKLEDVSYMSLELFIKRIARDKFMPDDVIKQEKQVYQTLIFEVDLVVCIDFLSLICKIYSIPEYVEQTAENILYLLQMVYSLQLLPSMETLTAIYFASLNHQTVLAEELFLLFGGSDFSAKAEIVYNALVRNQEILNKFRNPQVYRNFELDVGNFQVRVLNKSD